MNSNTGPQFDSITIPEITTTKGLTLSLGQIVTAPGSKLTRRIVGIDGDTREARCIRTDGKAVSSSMWLPVDRLTVAE